MSGSEMLALAEPESLDPNKIRWSRRVLAAAQENPTRRQAFGHFIVKPSAIDVVYKALGSPQWCPDFMGAKEAHVHGPDYYISIALGERDRTTLLMVPDFARVPWGKDKPPLNVDWWILSPPSPECLALLKLIQANALGRQKVTRPKRQLGFIQRNRAGVEIDWRPIPKWKKLVPDNYTPDVVAAFHKIRPLCAGTWDSSAGGLVIIDGPPGTGKTHLIRSLIHSIPGLYVLASGSLLAQLEGPDLLAFLMDNAADTDTGLVLILEDADEVVVSRVNNGIGSAALLSTLLNATSGLLGDMTNLRVIATVNTWHEDRMDPAILRPGRLFQRISVGDLPVKQARQVVLRESNGQDLLAARVTEPTSLAQCYALARSGRAP